MALPLQGRTAVITGAAGGIGRALALQAGAHGMSLALADVENAALQDLERELSQRGIPCSTAVVDVRCREALDDFAATLFSAGHDIALVFANAGVMRAGISWELSAQDWDLSLDVNLKGAAHTAAAFMPGLLRQKRRARVVFTGSTSAFLPRPRLSAYSCSKHALWGLAEAMALELQEKKASVGVSLLSPAGVKTTIAAPRKHSTDAEVQAAIHELIEAFGMSPETLAELAFEALRREAFWILPHPDFKPALQARTQRVVDEAPPIP